MSPAGFGHQAKSLFEGMKLVMYDDTPDDNQVRKPTFIINAELGTALTSNENDNSFKLTRPKAIIFTDDKEELNLHSESGVFDGKLGIATLDGGVKLFSPRLNLTMESIVWDNNARTDNLERRLDHHNSGTGAHSTRGRKWALLYAERYNTRGEAMSREWHLKRDRRFRNYLTSLVGPQEDL